MSNRQSHPEETRVPRQERGRPRGGIRILRALLLDPFFFAGLAFALSAVVLAYQFRYPFFLDVGGPIDRPLLVWVHDPQLDKQTGIRYRWTTGGSELYIRDWGAGNPLELRVRVTRWQPPDRIADLTLYVNGLEFGEPQASGQGWQEYALPVTDPKFLASDGLRVKFETDTFIPKNEIPGNPDPRRLGIQLDSINLIPMQKEGEGWRAVSGLVWSPFKQPPFDLSLYFVGSALALYLGTSLFGIRRHYALASSFAFSICAAIALVWVRPYITLFADTFFFSLVASIFVGTLARAVIPRFFAWGGVQASESDINLLALLFAFAFLIKLDMLLYPQTISFDLLYHVHRLASVMEGNIFWSIPSGKNEFGGQPVPYLPSFYIFLAPFTKFVPPQLLVQLSGVLLDSVTIFFLYYLLRKYFDDVDGGTSHSPDGRGATPSSSRAGLFASAIYTIAPLAFIALSWGIYANIFGQILTLALLVALVEAFDRLTSARVFVIVALLFLFTLLSHTSVFASVVPLFGIWIALLFVLGRMWRSRPFWALIGSIVVASAVAFFAYYSEFLGLITEGTTQIAEAASDPNTRNVGDQGLTFLQLLQPARTNYVGVPLYIYAAALAGFAWLLYLSWRSPSRGRFLLVTMLTSWFAAFALLMFVRAEFGFSARYVNFVMPAIALCAGAALAWVYARGLLGRAISLGLVLLLTAQGLYLWYVLVMFQYH